MGDPTAFYEADADLRVHKWLHGIWPRRPVRPEAWRLYFVVIVGDEPVGMQDLIGDQFDSFGTVETSSWDSSDVRRRAIGSEMRSAILHLTFDGFGARKLTARRPLTTPAPTASQSALGTSATERHGPHMRVGPCSGSAGGSGARRGRPDGATTSR